MSDEERPDTEHFTFERDQLAFKIVMDPATGEMVRLDDGKGNIVREDPRSVWATLTDRERYERAAELWGLNAITDTHDDGTTTLRLHAYQGYEAAVTFDAQGKRIDA